MKILRTQSGQVAVEYVLMLCIMISIGAAILSQFKDFLTDPRNGFISGSLATFDKVLDGGNGINGKFKRFMIQK